MLSRPSAVQMIEESIAEINEGRDTAQRIPVSEDLVIFGGGSPLDSLDFVNLVAMLEERIETDAGKIVSLTESMFEPEGGQPFRSIASLADYLVERTATAPA